MENPQQKVNKLWLSVDGKIVENHKVEAYTCGFLLTNIQRTFNVLQEVKYHKQKDNILKLYFSSLSDGSSVFELVPSEIQTDLDSYEEFIKLFNDLTGDLFEYIRLLSIDPQQFKLNLETEFQDKTDIIRFLSGLLGIWSRKNRYVIGAAFSYEKPVDFNSYTSLPSHRYHFIQNLIQEYIEQTTVDIIGVVERIKGDDPRSFVIEDTMGEMVEIYYPPELEKSVISYFKSTVIVQGVLAKKARKNLMEFIKNVRPLRIHTITSIGDIKLRLPMEFRFFYNKDDETWNFVNEPFELFGSGKSFKDALDDLKESFESLIIGFLAFENEEITDRALEIKNELMNFIDFEECAKSFHPTVIKETNVT